MKTYGLFDIMGPIMIGPSSSHTAGACRIGRLAKKISGKDFIRVTFYLHGSFAETYLGHGTDKALVAGVLGIAVDDERLKNSFEIAKERGIEFHFEKTDLGEGVHPNTVKIKMEYADGRVSTVTGSSIGGGNVVITEADGMTIEYTNLFPTLIVKYAEQKGIIAFISTVIAENGLNIERITTSKTNDEVTLIMELSEELPLDIQHKILDEKRFRISKYLSKGY